MSERFDLSDEDVIDDGLAAAKAALARGELVVMPTDTVYGLAADAFDPASVERLRAAKGRGRDMPAPVLVASPTTLDALATGVPAFARQLVEDLWPGPLTLICRQQPSLTWDLGDAQETVAVRVPDHGYALSLLKQTGPLAVSSANLTGHPPATDVDDAEDMLGDSVAVYLDDGPLGEALASTILDLTCDPPRALRVGAIDLDQLREYAPDVLAPDDPIPSTPDAPSADAPSADAPSDDAPTGPDTSPSTDRDS